jgi:hypothetical protein
MPLTLHLQTGTSVFSLLEVVIQLECKRVGSQKTARWRWQFGARARRLSSNCHLWNGHSSSFNLRTHLAARFVLAAPRTHRSRAERDVTAPYSVAVLLESGSGLRPEGLAAFRRRASTAPVPMPIVGPRHLFASSHSKQYGRCEGGKLDHLKNRPFEPSPSQVFASYRRPTEQACFLLLATGSVHLLSGPLTCVVPIALMITLIGHAAGTTTYTPATTTTTGGSETDRSSPNIATPTFTFSPF